MEEDAQIDRNTGLPGRILERKFFETTPRLVARRLLGKLLVHRAEGQLLTRRIVEAEAYLGPHHCPPDPAAHSYRGVTPRTQVLFGEAGHAYVYTIYGRYFCMNVSCEVAGRAGCVLLRALEPLMGMRQMARNRGLDSGARTKELTAGPSRLCQALGLTRLGHNGLDLLDQASLLQLRDDGFKMKRILVTPRIGIHEAIDWPLRFAVRGSDCVSGPKAMRG